MKRKLLHRIRTADRHEAHIFHLRNAWLIHKDLYRVEILSKAYYSGFRRAIIYGWTGVSLETVKAQVEAWTTDELFKVNPYLMELARNWTPPPLP